MCLELRSFIYAISLILIKLIVRVPPEIKWDIIKSVLAIGTRAMRRQPRCTHTAAT